MSEEVSAYPVGEPAEQSSRGLVGWFAAALIAAVVIRMVASLIAGFVELSRDDRFGFSGKNRTGVGILEFTEFGDGIGALLYWHVRTQTDWFAGRQLALLTTVLAALTAVASFASIVGYALYLNGRGNADAMVAAVGRGASFGLIAVVAAVAAYRVTWQIDEQFAAPAPDAI
jgi:hypothetical protein